MATDINLIRSMKEFSKRMVQTAFRKPHQFRVEMDEAPEDWDLYVKEISQERYNIDTDPHNVGAYVFSYPTTIQPVTLSMTCYDNEDGRMYDWFEKRLDKMENKDGTWNVPAEYLLTCKIFRRLSDDSEVLRQEMRMFPVTLGSLTESLDGRELLEFPMTFIEFRTAGSTY